MGKAVSGITDAVGLTDTKDAGDQARKAADTQASYQREALEYLKEREALPQELREEALTQLSEFYQVPGQPMSQQALISQAMESPLYGAIMGGQQAGEEAIMRNAAMTGGLRSGDVQSNMYDYNTQLENTALLQSFNQQQQRDDYNRSLNLAGISGLANLPSNANAIAQSTAGIGQTLAQGRVADSQATIAAQNQNFQDIMGIGGMAFGGMGGGVGANPYAGGGQLGGSMNSYSDPKLKTNITRVGERNGHQWFKWTWNKAAEALGLHGSSEGVMADLVKSYMPDAVGNRDGYMTVDYSRLGV